MILNDYIIQRQSIVQASNRFVLVGGQRIRSGRYPASSQNSRAGGRKIQTGWRGGGEILHGSRCGRLAEPKVWGYWGQLLARFSGFRWPGTGGFERTRAPWISAVVGTVSLAKKNHVCTYRLRVVP